MPYQSIPFTYMINFWAAAAVSREFIGETTGYFSVYVLATTDKEGTIGKCIAFTVRVSVPILSYVHQMYNLRCRIIKCTVLYCTVLYLTA